MAPVTEADILKDKLKKIEAFSECYKNQLLAGSLFEESGSWKRVRNDWWLALKFFFDRAFYQGRNDTLSSHFKLATVAALDGVLDDLSSEEKLSSLKNLSPWLDRERWKNEDNPLWAALSKKYDIYEDNKNITEQKTGRERDREMVLNSLHFVLNECEGCNILEHSIQCIHDGEIAKLSNNLHNIVSVGDKIASFFLRDTVFVYGLEKYLKPEDYDYVVPVDLWVRRVAKKLGIEATAKSIAVVCLQKDVSPIKFDQGAWYLGKNSFELLLDTL